MASMLDWNDIKYFLSVAEEGSTLAAGRALRVSRPPSPAELPRWRKRWGFSCSKSARLATLTPAGEELVQRARNVDLAANGFSETSAALARDTSGTVRITTQEIFVVSLLAPMLRELHERHPEILIELDDSQDFRDLGEGEADIALRSAYGDLAGVVGRRLGDDD
jgi:DNA-binding transcriptional LysR family regulator